MIKDKQWQYLDWLSYTILFLICYYLFIGYPLMFLSRILPPHLPITIGHFFSKQAYHYPYIVPLLLSSLNRWLALSLLSLELALNQLNIKKVLVSITLLHLIMMIIYNGIAWQCLLQGLLGYIGINLMLKFSLLSMESNKDQQTQQLK